MKTNKMWSFLRKNGKGQWPLGTKFCRVLKEGLRGGGGRWLPPFKFKLGRRVGHRVGGSVLYQEV